MAEDNGKNSVVTSLSPGVVLQLVLILVGIGVAWGTLTVRLAAIETAQATYSNIATSQSSAIIQDIGDLRGRVSRLEEELRKRR